MPALRGDHLDVAYAKFGRRLQALVIDVALIVVLFYVGAVVVDSVAPTDAVRRGLWVMLLAVMILYEPLLVSFFGGTLGHRVKNLRVVDALSQSNLGLVRAIARTLVKLFLGWFSFISMTVTRRHQAVHDVLTRSVVSIRDLAKATPAHYVAERRVDSTIVLPSRLRRTFVIAGYIVAAFVAVVVISTAGTSEDCLLRERCTRTDDILAYALVGCWISISVGLVIMGWKGRLWGARAQRIESLKNDAA